MQKVVIIIPTYNEAETISDIIDQLQEKVVAKLENFSVILLIFDSHSPDGTAEIVVKRQDQYDNILLMSEAIKSGLGSAYIKAMNHAIRHLEADIIFEFDADGSHLPEHIPDMLAYFAKGYDVVLGSRFVSGGSIDSQWSPYRKLLSCGGNWLARWILSSKIKDYTSGFRATRSSYLQKINLDQLLSKNYAYKIHLIWLLHLLKANIFEFPIHFIDRKKGKSKFPKNNAIESLILILRLRGRRVCNYLSKITAFLEKIYRN